MEKLQAALQKARERRGEAAPAASSAAGPRRPQRVSAAEVNAAWEAIPKIEVEVSKMMRKRLVSLHGGAEATPFDVLRTKVLQMMEANGWHRLVITSPAPGSGKTTTAANLAISLARQVDLKVILMDLDMRRPALAKAIGHKDEVSVDAVLGGVTPFGEQARRLGDNLALSMNYSASSDPSDIFLRGRTSGVIDEIEATYRPSLMLFDMPPMMVNDDTSAFLRNADCALIIAEAGVSTVAQIDVCEKELAEQTNVLGVVLNKCRYQADGYGYYYYNYGY